jgi:hypothetical protein
MTNVSTCTAAHAHTYTYCSCSHVHCSCSHVRCVLTVTTAGSSNTHGPQRETFISTSTKTGSKCELITRIMTTTDKDGDDNDAATPTTARNRLYLAHEMHTHTARPCRLHCTVHARAVVVSLCLRFPPPHSTQIHTAAKKATTREAAEPPAVRACTPARTNVRTKERTKAHTCTETDTHTYRSLQQPQARNRHCYNSCWSAPHMYCLLAPPPPPLLSRSFDGSGIDLQSWLNVANAAESTSPTRHEHGALCADTQLLLFCHNV